jgi:hypothetical protein
LNADTTFLEIFFRDLRREAQARPIGGYGIRRSARFRDDEAAIDQPLQGFVNLVRWKIPFQRAHELAKTLSTLAYRGSECAIELAVKKELAVLGIEAHDLGRQHIDGEIRREPRNILAVMLRNAIAGIACHAVSTRVSTLIATSPDRHCKTRILELARAPPSRSPAGVSR